MQEVNKGCQPQPYKDRNGLMSLQEVALFQGRGKQEGSFSGNPPRISEICLFIVSYREFRQILQHATAHSNNETGRLIAEKETLLVQRLTVPLTHAIRGRKKQQQGKQGLFLRVHSMTSASSCQERKTLYIFS